MKYKNVVDNNWASDFTCNDACDNVRNTDGKASFMSWVGSLMKGGQLDGWLTYEWGRERSLSCE